jgi:hypothetical protein
MTRQNTGVNLGKNAQKFSSGADHGDQGCLPVMR